MLEFFVIIETEGNMTSELREDYGVFNIKYSSL